MPACEHPAVLIITQQVVDTSTSVARDRYQLRCDLEAGHNGPHHDSRHHESWEGTEGQYTTLLRHEGERPPFGEPDLDPHSD